MAIAQPDWRLRYMTPEVRSAFLLPGDPFAPYATGGPLDPLSTYGEGPGRRFLTDEQIYGPKAPAAPTPTPTTPTSVEPTGPGDTPSIAGSDQENNSPYSEQGDRNTLGGRIAGGLVDFGRAAMSMAVPGYGVLDKLGTAIETNNTIDRMNDVREAFGLAPIGKAAAVAAAVAPFGGFGLLGGVPAHALSPIEHELANEVDIEASNIDRATEMGVPSFNDVIGDMIGMVSPEVSGLASQDVGGSVSGIGEAGTASPSAGGTPDDQGGGGPAGIWHTGGPVYGRDPANPREEVRGRLLEGEFVWSPEVVAAFGGPEVLDRIQGIARQRLTSETQHTVP